MAAGAGKRTTRHGRAWGRVAAIPASVAAVVLAAAAAPAYDLDADGNVHVRLRAYSLVSMSMQDYQVQSDPPIRVGQVVQQRNFVYPEVDVQLTPFLQRWLGGSFFDEVSLRAAAWGFYDGYIDYGAAGFADRVRQSRIHFMPDGEPFPHGAFQTKGKSVVQALEGRGRARNARDIYGARIRANEAYVNLVKGPLFLRIGRQAISWGESDTIALLDANNPFDTTILPGLFIDIDEARIPLWTLRATYQLFGDAGLFSSGFVDAYIVPGVLDATVSPLQMASVSPFSAPPAAPPPNVTEIFQLLPPTDWSSTRWGVRFQTVIARDFTTSLWFYKTFQTVPVPLFAGVSQVGHGIVTTMNQRLTNVAGIATTFFFAPISAIVRSEIEVFNGEPAFRYATNIAPALAGEQARMDKINIIRGELGIDRNVFITALNPNNSFTWISALVFEANPNFTKYKVYRASGLLKPSAIARQEAGGPPAGTVTAGCDGRNEDRGCDFVKNSAFSAFVQSHMETTYLYGKLTPGITAIVSTYGSMAIIPQVAYRVTDSFILDAKYINIHTFGSDNTGFNGLGVFRDRDEVWLRATYQLN
jgi:hypothetical protein